VLVACFCGRWRHRESRNSVVYRDIPRQKQTMEPELLDAAGFGRAGAQRRQYTLILLVVSGAWSPVAAAAGPPSYHGPPPYSDKAYGSCCLTTA